MGASFVNELSDADREKENWHVMTYCISSIGFLPEEKSRCKRYICGYGLMVHSVVSGWVIQHSILAP